MDEIKKLREETGAGVMDAKRALEEAKGDMKLAKKVIADKGLAKAAKKADRVTGDELCLPIFITIIKAGRWWSWHARQILWLEPMISRPWLRNWPCR